ncbi:DUF3846 domain-containing protein [Streptomyces sp. NPDC001205]
MASTTLTAPRFAALIEADGGFGVMEWPTDASAHLDLMYAAIGCSIVEAVDLATGLTMWFDEEGPCTGQPVNVPATQFVGFHRPTHQAYYGDALITGGTDSVGNTVGLDEDQIFKVVCTYLTILDTKIPSQRTHG